MRIFGKKPITILGLLILFSTVSCKKWVDETPQPMQVDESKVFSNEQGFRDALNAVYIEMGAQALYGRDLTMGVVSVMGRSYDNVSETAGPLFYQSSLYNVQNSTVRDFSFSVWNKMYKSIANLNNLLANIETRKAIFTGNNYNTFKGEALALRAYLHFDLLRLFAPSPASGASLAPAIPYVKTISTTSTPVSSVDEVLNQCIMDLTEANQLLNPADVTTSQMNSWAVKGLLARVYMYRGDIANAQSFANEVIKSNRFPLAKNNSDLFFTNESLFKLYIFQNDYYSFYKSVMITPTPVGLGLSTANQTALYVTGAGVGASDWRKNFMSPTSGAPTVMPTKFSLTNANTFPMIRLTEMYYIAAECAVNNKDANTAIARLDTVRAHRKLPIYASAISLDSLNVEIKKEYQKEFIGEGQAFFYFKRKNTPFKSLPFTNTKVPVSANASYTFAKPE